jgi:hypothetical protein
MKWIFVDLHISLLPGNIAFCARSHSGASDSEPGPRDRGPMRLTYPFTRSSRLAYRHYLLSLSGLVKPEDEPERLLRASIARARASITEARKSKRELKD